MDFATENVSCTFRGGGVGFTSREITRKTLSARKKIVNT